MLSVLVPTYNYSIKNLLTSLNDMFGDLSLDYEIICWEDGSTSFIEENKVACEGVKHALHIISEKNNGRITTRKSLAEKAKYDWLLFLDADVIPKHRGFIKTYLENIKNTNVDAIYGGCSYDSKKPENQYMLRWKYGSIYEQVTAKNRSKSPYKHIVSANFVIKRHLFLNIISKIKNEGYGFDIYLGALMKSSFINVLHIDNVVIHYGLDLNSEFLKKTRTAVKRLYDLKDEKVYRDSENSLLRTFKKLKSFGLKNVVATLFKLAEKKISKNLLSANPNMWLLQFYKLGYLCSLSSNKK